MMKPQFYYFDTEILLRTNDENVAARHCRIKCVRLKNDPGFVWVLF